MFATQILRRILRARPAALTAAATFAAPAGAAAAPVAATPSHAPLASGIALLGAAAALIAARRPKSTVAPPPAPTGEWIARHRQDGHVLTLDGAGFAEANGATWLGEGFLDQLHEEDRPRFLDLAREAGKPGAPQAALLRLRRTETAGFMPIEVRCRPCEIEPGTVVTAIRDGAAMHALAEQLEAAREETRHAKLLKDRMLANMSHELRTPLNAILGFSEILGDPTLAPAEPEKRVEYARIIHASADHLLSVVNLVLDMSRIEAGKFAIEREPLELAPLIRECVDMLRLRAEQGGVTLEAAPVDEGLEIFADKRACRQILVNLLSNAVKFTRPGGQVLIEAVVDGEEARLRVTDNGIGIEPECLPRIGDAFYQVKNGYNRSFEGAGLGLSLVRGLVGLHDGELLLESALGLGTRVTALLPIAPREGGRRVGAAPLRTAPYMPAPAATVEHQERLIA